MGRQFRPPRRGSGVSVVAPALVSSSSSAIAIPNYGVTDISTWPAGEYVLDAPDIGVSKIFVSVSSSSAARVIRMSTGTNITIGNGGATQIATGQTTVPFCVELIGLNSTGWAIRNVYPPASTAGAVTFGTS